MSNNDRRDLLLPRRPELFSSYNFHGTNPVCLIKWFGRNSCLPFHARDTNINRVPLYRFQFHCLHSKDIGRVVWFRHRVQKSTSASDGSICFRTFSQARKNEIYNVYSKLAHLSSPNVSPVNHLLNETILINSFQVKTSRSCRLGLLGSRKTSQEIFPYQRQELKVPLEILY